MDLKDALHDFLMRIESYRTTAEERLDELRLKLIKFFVWKDCEDPDGLAEETIRRLTIQLQGRVAGKEPLQSSDVYSLATQVFQEFSTKRGKSRTPTTAGPVSGIVPLDASDHCRGVCWESLSQGNRQLIQEYYFGKESVAAMAEKLGVSSAALRLRIHRIKLQLKDCLEACTREEIAGSNTTGVKGES